jgi:hypothetical protein
MKRFTVSLCRVEHRIYQIEVEADTPDEAHDVAVDMWAEDDEAFTDFGAVHAEEFIEDVKEKREAA